MWRFGPIGDLLRWILDAIYSLVGNYGWSVLIFTLLIRICPCRWTSRAGAA